jgi:hypothetical protein
MSLEARTRLGSPVSWRTSASFSKTASTSLIASISESRSFSIQ